MAHLIPLSETIATQKGVAFGGNYLGYEIGIHEGSAQFELEIERLRRAAGNLAMSTDPDHQRVHRQIEARFAHDTEYAPADFPFHRNPGQTIIDLLHQANDATIVEFQRWHKEHFSRQQEAIRDSQPDMLAQIEIRNKRLVQAGLLPPDAIDKFCLELHILTRLDSILPIDSFDGALIDGCADYKGNIYLSHRFANGYWFGKPTEAYWKIAHHEVGHRTRMMHGTDFSGWEFVEEALLEHCVAVAADGADAEALSGNMFQAAEQGAYRGLRKLIALSLAQSRAPLHPGELTPMLNERRLDLLASARSAITTGLATIFPEHGNAALPVFLERLKATHMIAQGAYADEWAARAISRVGPPRAL